MSREKRRKTEPQQQTLGQAVARAAAADQEISLYAELDEEPPLLLEKLWVSIKNQYEETYCHGSPILKLTNEEAAPTGARSSRKTRTEDGIKEEVDAELHQERVGIMQDQSWEHAGDHILKTLEPLVNKAHALPMVLQQWLLHMVLNHEFHAGDLSLRALKLLERNARLHPPCWRKPDTAATLVTNSQLWVPGLEFQRSEASKLPELMADFRPYLMFLELWMHAERYCNVDTRGRGASSRTAPVRPGYILMLSYCLTLLRMDMDVRMALANERPSDPRMYLALQHSKLWRLLANMGPGVTNMWTGLLRNHVKLTRTLASTLLACCHTAGSNAGSGSPQGTPVPAYRGGAGPSGEGAAGPSNVPQQQQQQQVTCPLSRHEVGVAAGWMLQALYTLFEAAERPTFFNHIYDRKATDKGTHRGYMAEELLLLLTGSKPRGLELDAEATALVARLRDPAAKLVLLRALSPSAQLHLLGLDFADKADKSWAARGAGGVEGIGGGLSGHLSLLKEYRDARGLVAQGMEGLTEVNAVEVLHALAPAAGGPDLYDAATKSLFKVGTSVNERGGFVMWLAAFVRAAVEQQQALKASDAAAADAVVASQGGPNALKDAFAAVQQRMQGDGEVLEAGCGLPARLALATAARLVQSS